MRPVSKSRKSGRKAAGNPRRDPRKPARPKAHAPARGTQRKARQAPPEGLWQRLSGRIAGHLSFRRPMAWMTGLLIVLVLIAGLFAGGYVRAATDRVDAAAAAVSDYAGFGISKLHLSGENRTPPQMILAVLNLKPGQSIFDADLRDARARLMQLPWVSQAQVARRYPDSISVAIVEKTPFALWQSTKGLYVIERSGAPITKVDAKAFPKLPVFVGDRPVGCDELVAAIAGHRAVVARVTAMQRVSGRRWNLILDSGVVVKLPENGWRRQLDVLERLIVDKGVLERDIEEIDLRSKDNYFFVLRGHKDREPVAREHKA